MARRRPGQSGAVAKLPLDAKGLAPRIRRWSVRSTSASGMDSIVPNISPDDTCFGIWSSVEAEKTLRVPIIFIVKRSPKTPAVGSSFNEENGR